MQAMSASHPKIDMNLVDDAFWVRKHAFVYRI